MPKCNKILIFCIHLSAIAHSKLKFFALTTSFIVIGTQVNNEIYVRTWMHTFHRVINLQLGALIYHTEKIFFLMNELSIMHHKVTLIHLKHFKVFFSLIVRQFISISPSINYFLFRDIFRCFLGIREGSQNNFFLNLRCGFERN